MYPQTGNSPAWNSRTKRIVAIGSLVVIGLTVAWLAEILPLVMISAVLAYLLYPIVSLIERRILGTGPLRRVQGRGLAVALTFVLVIALFAVIVLVIAPVIVAQLEEFGRNIPQLLQDLEDELERILSEPLMFNGEPVLIEGKPFIPLERLLEATGTRGINDLLHLENLDVVGAAQTFLGSLGSVTGPAFGFLGDAFNALINFTFLIVMMIYLMKDGERFAHRLVELTSDLYQDDARRLLHELARVWNAYLRGQILVSVITGVLIFVAAVILGLPNAPMLGLFSGLLQLIPNIGPFLAIIPAAFLALVSQSNSLSFLSGLGFMLVVVAVWIVIQDYILFVIVPRLMGRTLDLHPYVVIIAVIGGASVAGALGVILSVPFVASARLLAGYVYGKLMDRDPFPKPRVVSAARAEVLWQRVGALLNRRIPARLRTEMVRLRAGSGGVALSDVDEEQSS